MAYLAGPGRDEDVGFGRQSPLKNKLFDSTWQKKWLHGKTAADHPPLDSQSPLAGPAAGMQSAMNFSRQKAVNPESFRDMNAQESGAAYREIRETRGNRVAFVRVCRAVHGEKGSFLGLLRLFAANQSKCLSMNNLHATLSFPSQAQSSLIKVN
jgi:hypothetical protein